MSFALVQAFGIGGDSGVTCLSKASIRIDRDCLYTRLPIRDFASDSLRYLRLFPFIEY